MVDDFPIPGRMYRHYKGNLYEVICISKETESQRDLVTYRGPDGKNHSRFFHDPDDGTGWNDPAYDLKRGFITRFTPWVDDTAVQRLLEQGSGGN